MNEKTVKHTFYAVVVICVFLSAYTLIGSLGDTEDEFGDKIYILVPGDPVEYITTQITSETQTPIITTITQPTTTITTTRVPQITTKPYTTTYTTTYSVQFTGVISGEFRLTDQNGNVIESHELKQRKLATIPELMAAEVTRWEVDFAWDLNSADVDWSSLVLKFKLYFSEDLSNKNIQGNHHRILPTHNLWADKTGKYQVSATRNKGELSFSGGLSSALDPLGINFSQDTMINFWARLDVQVKWKDGGYVLQPGQGETDRLILYGGCFITLYVYEGHYIASNAVTTIPDEDIPNCEGIPSREDCCELRPDVPGCWP